MFDFAWSELALIAVVAIVVIGPKDLPDAIRKVAKGIQKLRRMASEFQSHADELVREAKLEDVRDQIRDIRNFDLRSTIERNLDADGDIRRTFSEDPLKEGWKPDTSPKPQVPGDDASAPSNVAKDEAPAFVPPDVAKPSGDQLSDAHGAGGDAAKPLTSNP
ncbi:Sec-independent protein translocase protein TatB [Pseudoroseomonas globiformis]|uniref:Sec-independent protein translocase protein TatB n=1 Tax=Teichococcus globiformis TaxID=2307229 RepID=A0ABV7G2B5_9PROT